jgi:hypothetical protein
MPFTFSHPAAVIPLARTGLPFSALVVGSMVPDAASFWPLALLGIERNTAHSPTGLLFFCLPVGLGLLWLFHSTLKLPLLSLLPRSHQSKLAPAARGFRFGPAGQSLLVVLALAVGACTHVGWDAFTHAGPLADNHLTVLYRPVLRTPFGEVVLFKLMQLASHVGGIVVLAAWCRLWMKRARPEPLTLAVTLPRSVKIAVLVGTMVVPWGLSALYHARGAAPASDDVELRGQLRSVAVDAISLMALELLFFSLWWHWAARRGNSAHDHRAS